MRKSKSKLLHPSGTIISYRNRLVVIVKKEDSVYLIPIDYDLFNDMTVGTKFRFEDKEVICESSTKRTCIPCVFRNTPHCNGIACKSKSFHIINNKHENPKTR